MNEKTIQDIFEQNWVFWLFTKKKWSVGKAIGWIVILPMVVFGTIAILLGEFQLYKGNLLTYSGPVWVALALVAYQWFARAFPRSLMIFAPALDVPEKVIIETVKKWADELANRLSIMILVSLPLSFAAFQDTFTLWTSPTSEWMGTPWVLSNHPLFFAVVWSFYYGVSVSFMLGSGIVGISGCALLINELLKMPLKLEYYRRLRSLLDLSTGIGMWTFASFAMTVIGQAFIKPNSTANLLTSSLFLSVMASISLLVAFLSPLFPARNAIILAKNKKLELYEKSLHEIETKIEKMISSNRTRGASYEKLDKDHKSIQQKIKEIETIPEWPITSASLSRILSASVIMPILNGIPNFFMGDITDYIKGLFTK